MSKAKKKLKYAIIQNTNLEEFCKQCNQALADNYIPVGGITAVTDIKSHSEIKYTQAFTYEIN